jgi:transketolase
MDLSEYGASAQGMCEMEGSPDPGLRMPGEIVVPAELDTLRWLCRQFRRDLLHLTLHSGTGTSHLGGELSVVELLAVLFFHTLRLDPNRPDWEGRDRFVLSKGHASAAMYVAMAWRGFFPRARLFDSFNRLHGILQEHVNLKTPGAEIPTGSLGMGLSAGAGMAWGSRYLAQHENASPWQVYVVLSDGDCTEGQTWEAAMAAAHFGLDNLVAVVDDNQRLVTGPTRQVMNLEPLAAKWESFGWHVRHVDGHDVGAVRDVLEAARRPEAAPGRPRIVLARTVKGKGISFMENNDAWHAGHLTEAQYSAALAELKG